MPIRRNDTTYKLIVNPFAGRGAGERAIPQIEQIFALIPHFLRGTQATQEPIRTGRARRVVVTAVEGVLPAHADGETLCTDGQRLELELLPRQIQVIYQPPEAVE